MLTRLEGLNSETDALIILGDAGFNFYLNKTDDKLKEQVNQTNILVYCVRGNHEQRPEYIPGMQTYYDVEICGFVYLQEKFPNIRYLKDGETYSFNNLKTLVIGGAYSVDKFYRIANGRKDWCGWFEGEQLTREEMEIISNDTVGNHYDVVLTHTCPYSWQPTDLFLDCIDQSSIDNSMELWLDGVSRDITFNLWLFAHYHQDRVICPKVEMLFESVRLLNALYCDWNCN